jgi:NADPH:quinone reductase-like Zn-dependent oxidoreductase
MAGACASAGRLSASPTPACVRAAVLHRYGFPHCGLFEDPVSTGEQIVLDVCAAGVNHFDVMMGLGTSYAKPDALPYIVGRLDGVGRLGDGRRVYFESTVAPYGAAAERTLVEPEAIVELPPGLDDAVAAALGNCGLAAWLSLQWRARLAAGETVLVLGATGTVGRLARFVQVGVLAGAEATLDAGVVRQKSLAILGYANYHVPRDERHAAYLRLAGHAAAGRIAVDFERLPLEQVARAWERQLAGAPSKLVLVPGSSS